MPRICIIDYELGNVMSLQNALNKLNFKSIISRELEIITNSDYLILPGVGSFNKGMSQLKKFNLIEILNEEVIVKKKKVLGICLGFHLMCKNSSEFDSSTKGLGWLDLSVTKINSGSLRLPHTGWNKFTYLDTQNQNMRNISSNDFFYFNHSFCIRKNTDETFKILSKTSYGDEFISSGCKNHIFGIQPHPEKSQEIGLKFLKNIFS
jgi:imidazole glycerol-phosphate synthase subunit HisH